MPRQSGQLSHLEDQAKKFQQKLHVLDTSMMCSPEISKSFGIASEPFKERTINKMLDRQSNAISVPLITPMSLEFVSTITSDPRYEKISSDENIGSSHMHLDGCKNGVHL